MTKEWKIELEFSNREQRNLWVKLIRQIVKQMERIDDEEE